MKKNTVSSIFILGVVLISLFLLTAYRPEVKRAPAADIAANHLPVVVDPADRKFSFAANHVPVVVDPADRKFSFAAYHVTAEMEAADLSSSRWQAMAKFYEEQGMLTRDNFDYGQAADLSAARWQAMGEFYVEQASGINYAMDTVDLKLFNSAEVSPSTMAAEGAGIVYAMDPVDLKLFNSAETAPTTVAVK